MREIDIINSTINGEADAQTRAEIDKWAASGGKKFSIPMDQQEDGLHIDVEGTEYVIRCEYEQGEEVWTARTGIDPRILEADNWRTLVNKCVVSKSQRDLGYYGGNEEEE